MGGSIQKQAVTGKCYIVVYWKGKHYRIYNDPRTGDQWGKDPTSEPIVRSLKKIRIQVDDKIFDPRTWLPNNPFSVREYGLLWLSIINVSKKTRIGYRTALFHHINPRIGEMDIRQIHKSNLELLYNELQLSEKSKANVLGTLKSMLRFARDDEVLKSVPPFPRLPHQPPPVTYLTLEQQETILKAIPERDRPIFQFMMEYGTRVGEARALMWDCITQGKIIIRRAFSENDLREVTKTRLVRTEEITTYFQSILDNIPRNLSQFVFVRSDFLPYTNKNLNRIWKHACDEAKMPRIKLYNACRHSHAGQLLDAGFDIKTVSDALGHSDIRTSMRYSRRSQMKSIRENLRKKVIHFPGQKTASQ